MPSAIMPRSFRFEGFTLDLGRGCLRRGDHPIDLRPKSFAVLHYLVENAERLVSKDELFKAVWPNVFVTDDALIHCISEIRAALGDRGQHVIKTVPRRGYLFAAALTLTATSDRSPQSSAVLAPKALATDSADSAAGVCSDVLVPNQDRACVERPSAERRQLTVMACELIGLAALSGRLDPEDLRLVTTAAHRFCAELAGRHGGYIARYLDDVLIVYFGDPEAHEHDAEQAVRAALALAGAASQADGELDPRLRIRIGIASGIVVVGNELAAGLMKERTAVGEAPNLAMRLRAVAGAGGVVVDRRTRRLIGGLFEYRDLRSVALDGYSERIDAWQVLQPSPAESRFDAKQDAAPTPIAGREEELALLMRRWNQARSGAGGVVLITGEPGIGKSRLAAALSESLEGDEHVQTQYFCSPQHTDSALFPVIAQLRRSAKLSPEDPPERTLDKVRSLLTPEALYLHLGHENEPKFAMPTASSREAFPTEQEVALVTDLLSVPTDRYQVSGISQQRRKELTLETITASLTTFGAVRPVLVLLEDAHWADPTTLELLALLIERVHAMRVLIVITARPEFSGSWPQHSHVTTLVLRRLSRKESAEVVDRVLRGKALPQEALAQILARGDGVPLFLEELTKTLLESGVLQERQDGYVLTTPLLASTIPSTLHGSLFARLDRIPEARQLAQIGAVIGREFSYALLHAVADPPRGEHLRTVLDQLVASQLMSSRGVAPDAIYAFKHVLVQGVAYDSLLRERRQALHARIAAVLEEKFVDIVAQQPEVLAYHCAHAGLTEKAVTYWLNAGRQSAAQSATVEAVSRFRKGLDLLANLPDGPERGRRELELQRFLGGVLFACKGQAAPEAGQAWTRAAEICEQLGDASALAQVLNGLCSYHLGRCELVTARRIAEDLMRLSQRRNDPTCQSFAHRSLGICSYMLGEFASAKGHFELSLDAPLAQNSLAPIDPRVTALSYLAADLFLLGYPDQAVLRSNEALDLSRGLRHPHSLTFALTWAVGFDLIRRAEAVALERVAELISLATDQGFPVWLATAKVMLGRALAASNESEKGLAPAREGLADLKATGVLSWQTFNLGLVAQIHAYAARGNEALVLADRALEVAELTGERWFEAELHRLKGEWTACHRSDQVKAQECFLRGIAVAREQNAKSWELRAALSLARLWRDQEKRTQARALLSPIYDFFTEGFHTPDLEEARALLESLE
jgi:class 3 adenylate cyclase/tetratricopeptide (TPR) repeat protein